MINKQVHTNRYGNGIALHNDIQMNWTMYISRVSPEINLITTLLILLNDKSLK